MTVCKASGILQQKMSVQNNNEYSVHISYRFSRNTRASIQCHPCQFCAPACIDKIILRSLFASFQLHHTSFDLGAWLLSRSMLSYIPVFHVKFSCVISWRVIQMFIKFHSNNVLLKIKKILVLTLLQLVPIHNHTAIQLTILRVVPIRVSFVSDVP